MKKAHITGFAVTLLIMLLAYIPAAAQGPAPPPGGPGTSGPIDSGAAILLVFAALYGYNSVKKSENTEESNEATA